MRRAILLTVFAALALPVQTARGGDDDDRPFRRGMILPSVALGGSFTRNYGGSLLVGAGASYFVVGGLAVGLHLRNVSTFYSQDYKQTYAPWFSQIPTNEFSLTPSLLWVIYRGQRVAPYVSLGAGPVFLNKKRGVLGQWSVGPGVMIGTGGPLWIDLGLGFGMRFTGDRCERAYTFTAPGAGTLYADRACSFTWGFRGGLVFGIGGRRQPRIKNSRPSPPPGYQSPPASSYPEPEPYTAPAPAQPVPEASPPPSPPPPVEPPSEGPPPAPLEPAPAPLETPPEPSPAPPPGESLTVPPPA